MHISTLAGGHWLGGGEVGDNITEQVSLSGNITTSCRSDHSQSVSQLSVPLSAQHQ